MTDTAGNNEPDVFALLKDYDVSLSRHVECVLKKLGYQCLRSISSIENPNDLEYSVRTLLGNEEHFSKMSMADREMIFGEFYKDNPEYFEFLPGERPSIVGAISMAKKLLENYEKQYSFEHGNCGKRKSMGLENNVSKKKRTTEVSGNRLPIRRHGVTAKEYFERWLSKTNFPVDFSSLNIEFSPCDTFVECIDCKVKFNCGHDPVNGCWKLSSIQSHVKRVHHKKVRPVSTPPSKRTPLLKMKNMNSKEIEEAGSRSLPATRRSSSRHNFNLSL